MIIQHTKEPVANLTPGERLKMIMSKKGITQEALAEDSGLSQPTIGRIIKGVGLPNFEILQALRTKYKVNINEFFDKK